MIELKEYIGECIGTFILVFFGCGAVAASVLFNALTSLLEVAIVFGFGVTIAIFMVRNLCPAHLNPAVSIGMVVSKKLSFKKLPLYIISQLLGAFIGAAVLYFAFADGIQVYEQTNSIIRGSNDSFRSAMMFGEYFPNPSFADKLSVSPFLASCMEGIGTFILVFVILRLTEKEKQIDNSTPILIGLTVMLLICIIAPFTQGGFNPARDFAPRIVAYFAGWGSAAFPSIQYSFFTVYILSPVLGGVVAAYFQRFLK